MLTHEIIAQKPQLPVFFNVYTTNNQLIPSHWHNHLEVLYIYQGNMTVVRNEEKYLLGVGDLFVLNSGDIHFTLSKGYAQVLLLQIPYELLIHSIPHYKTLRFQEYFPLDEIKRTPALEEMVRLLGEMRWLYAQAPDGYPFLFSSNLHLFLHHLFKDYSFRQTQEESNKATRHLGRLKEIIDFVHAHYKEPISLAQVSSLVALNPEYFCRTFKKYTGFTFMEYVNIVRLTHIHEDMLQSDDSITTLQERHGFTNYKVFNRMFKESYGCTPSKLRFSL